MNCKTRRLWRRFTIKGNGISKALWALAYKLGGGGYKAPVQLVGDFMKDRVSTKIGKVRPSYTGAIFWRLKKMPSIIRNRNKKQSSLW